MEHPSGKDEAGVTVVRLPYHYNLLSSTFDPVVITLKLIQNIGYLSRGLKAKEIQASFFSIFIGGYL